MKLLLAHKKFLNKKTKHLKRRKYLFRASTKSTNTDNHCIGF